MSACYDVHLRKITVTESKTSALRSKLVALQEQKAILELKLQSYECIPGTGNVTVTRDIRLPHSFQEVARQLASYEVNELQMKRRHAILHEELKAEKIRRGQAENALSEVEATFRSRILYLELWKQGSVARIERLQAELDESSPNLPLSCVKAKRPVKTRFLSAQAQHVCA
jgi:predicted ATP-dependent protease